MGAPTVTARPATIQAPARHDHLGSDPSALCVYTDGSSKKKRLAAAAVIPSPQISRTAYLGQTRDFKGGVEAGEMYGIMLALKLARERGTPGERIAIFTDYLQIAEELTQAKEYGPKEMSSKPKEIQNVISSAQDLQREGMDVSVYWIHGNVGPECTVTGSKLAHKIAKQATDAAALIVEDARQVLTLTLEQASEKIT